MKKIYIYIGIAVWSLTSCNQLLDELPDNQVRIDTPEKARRLLTNAYPKTSEIVISELSSDNIDDNGTIISGANYLSNEASYWQVIREYNNSDGLQNVWTAHYQAINTANTVLEAIEKMGTSAELNACKGEALVARAYAHFVLVNLFSKPYNPNSSSSDLGIPYMLEPESELNRKYERGTVAEVYAKINADLSAGLPLINDSYYQTPKYHFNKKAAYAFAARFYLYYQQWQKALDAANVVLSTNDATTEGLLRNWSDFTDARKTGGKVFGRFAIYYTNERINANLLLLPVSSEISETYFTPYTRFVHNKRTNGEETLVTANLWYPQRQPNNNFSFGYYYFEPFTPTSARADGVVVDKFPKFNAKNEEGTTVKKSIVVPFTTDETLLVRAEAKIHLQQYASAINDLNMWTGKFIKKDVTIGGYTSKNQFNQQEIVDFYNNLAYSSTATDNGATQKKRLAPSFAIANDGIQEPLLHYLLQCRRILTLGEGLRWQDIRRYNIEVARYQRDNRNRNNSTIKAILPPDDLKRTIQLPDAVIGAGMQANPR